MIITDHGEERVRKRVGVPKGAVQAAAERAFENGIKREETSGSLRRYLDAEHHKENANNIRVWSEKVWIFYDKRLVTVFPLPQKYRKTVQKIRRGEEK